MSHSLSPATTQQELGEGGVDDWLQYDPKALVFLEKPPIAS